MAPAADIVRSHFDRLSESSLWLERRDSYRLLTKSYSQVLSEISWGITMKPCIACAEDIKDQALLCRFCNTRQDDPSFQSSPEQTISSLNPERSALLIRLVNDYKNAWDRFGPFQIVDERKAGEVDPHLVWTQVEGSEYLAMLGGLPVRESETGWYFIANRPFSDNDEFLITECAYFECETCDGDLEECASCQESGNVCLDIQEIVLRSGVSFDSAEEIWSQRVPGGTIQRIQLPEDFKNYPELIRPDWIN